MRIATVTFAALVAAAAGAVRADPDPCPLRPPPLDLSSGLYCHAAVAQTSGPDHGQLRRLDRLPDALLEHAVLREVNGCALREIVDRGGVRYLGPVRGRMEPAASTDGGSHGRSSEATGQDRP